MQSLNTLALVKGTFFCVSVLFELSPKNNKKNNNNKVKCKLTLRVSKNFGIYSFTWFFLSQFAMLAKDS